MDALLIHPPAVKPAEPPLGAAILLQHLRSCGLQAEVLDANLGAFLYLLDPGRLQAAAGSTPPTDLRRAVRHAAAALAFVRSPAASLSFARYATAVGHLERALAVWGDADERLSLGDYRHGRLSEFSLPDLERLTAGAEATLFAPYFRAELLPRVQALAPRLVGLSVNYRHQVLPAFELAGMLRRALPGVTIVGGGGVFSGWRRELPPLKPFAAFDRLIFGPGEAMLAALAGGSAPAGYCLEAPAPVTFRPDFSFARLSDYLSPQPTLPLAASRGCYWRQCDFCPEALAPVHPYRVLPPAELPALMRQVAETYGATHIHFTDDALPPAVLQALAAQSAGGPTWHGFARFEKGLDDPALVGRLAAAGCRLLQLGLESGSQAVLDRLRKGTQVAQAAAVLAALRQGGIAAYVYVLLGTPGETASDAEATLGFLQRHAEEIGFLNLAIMNLPRPAAEGELTSEEGLGFYRQFVPSPGWDRRTVRRFLHERMLASPAVRAAVRRVPPVFTSNHAHLFT